MKATRFTEDTVCLEIMNEKLNQSFHHYNLHISKT